ncbi:MAG: DNA polymerase IV [Gammaproteobacteria bacterium]|nr:DNA polymerase IV [Gammaproteobacteria bacterium]MBU0786398.1 DNA polymerase IV [Gammaproteobacteria bacterium]MBU0813584.1 DNA polymerase IV [Gammaproteobacteria bacterium]MBU1788945.1 DNA polymerase IV [Gammaproteobacteria bacterium]
MDAFFASVELLRYPQLKGLPVVIGGGRRREDDLLERLRLAQPEREWAAGDLAAIPVDFFPRLKDYTGRGVITTATYAARQFGVGSAMGLMKAARLCPQAILLPVDFEEIRKYSRLFKSTIREIAPLMEDRGVDEVYIDFTEVPGGQRSGGRSLARLIQKAILDATGLTCSVGVAPNKLIAKMASEFNKPNGISIVLEEDLQSSIWPLACRKINGIGPKADAKLQSLGIETIGQLAAKELPWLIEHFGRKTGAWMHEASHGHDDRPVVLESEPVSMSRETTFERDLHAVRDRAELGAIFTRLCEQVAADLQRKGYVGKTIGIKLRYDNFKTATRDQTVEQFTADARTIRQIAGQCLKRVPLDKRLRLLGVRVGTLASLDEAVDSASNSSSGLTNKAQEAMDSIAKTEQLF